MSISNKSSIQRIPTVYGADVTTFGNPGQTVSDLDPFFREVTGRKALAEAIIRRLETPRGSLPDDEDCGYDLRPVSCNETWQPRRLFQIQQGIVRECKKDERVFGARVKVSYIPSIRTLNVMIELDTMYGIFNKVLRVNEVSVSAVEGRI